MGRMKEKPRYHVISFRAADDEILDIMLEAQACGLSLSEYARRAILAGMIRDRVNRGLAA